MEFLREREEVIAAGKKLVAEGLIARTWGNVSCRVDGGRFAVTPSGRPYETLTPGDIVIVGIEDLQYEGAVKPSSEKGVHAEVYMLRPDARFVIHTHQTNASVAAALGGAVTVAGPEARRLLGDRVELAAYGLPGTVKLRRGVADALKRAGGRAVLMTHHGALCYGAGAEEAFAAALALEEECAVFTALDAAAPADGALPEAELRRAVCAARPDWRAVRVSTLPAVVAASRLGGAVRPLLDDFAQLIGLSARRVAWDAGNAGIGVRSVLRALQGRNAVLIEGFGAVCCAGSDEDAAAVEMVLDKGCRAALAAREHGGARPIAPAECALMRYVYLNKYSKLAVTGKPGR